MCGDLTTQLGLIKASKHGLRLRPETKLVQCFFDQHYHEIKENKILWKEQQMKTNTNIGFELWYSVLNVCFFKATLSC